MGSYVYPTGLEPQMDPKKDFFRNKKEKLQEFRVLETIISLETVFFPKQKMCINGKRPTVKKKCPFSKNWDAFGELISCKE